MDVQWLSIEIERVSRGENQTATTHLVPEGCEQTQARLLQTHPTHLVSHFSQPTRLHQPYHFWCRLVFDADWSCRWGWGHHLNQLWGAVCTDFVSFCLGTRKCIRHRPTENETMLIVMIVIAINRRCRHRHRRRHRRRVITTIFIHNQACITSLGADYYNGAGGTASAACQGIHESRFFLI